MDATSSELTKARSEATTTTSTSRASSSSGIRTRFRFTTRREGDFADVTRLPAGTTWLRQVHGATVVEVTEPGEHAGVDGDAAFTTQPGCVLAVRTADCVPVVLVGDGVIGVVHAGWRGLAGGVIQATAQAMGSVLEAHVGPHIRRGCYEFGATDLDTVAAVLGDHVRATTSWGTPALDLTEGVRGALSPADVHDDGACTACSDVFFSWRARTEHQRFATLAWLE
jgi:YfiH family protein